MKIKATAFGFVTFDEPKEEPKNEPKEELKEVKGDEKV